MIMVVLGALNTALATWLVNRRAKADKRENGKTVDRPGHDSLVSKQSSRSERDSGTRHR